MEDTRKLNLEELEQITGGAIPPCCAPNLLEEVSDAEPEEKENLFKFENVTAAHGCNS